MPAPIAAAGAAFEVKTPGKNGAALLIQIKIRLEWLIFY